MRKIKMTIDLTKDEVKYIKASINYNIVMQTAMLQSGLTFTRKEMKQYDMLLSIQQKLEKK